MAHRCNHCRATCLGHRASDVQPPPDIAQLMATNDPPSANQEEEFRQIRVDGVQCLADLETVIGELQQTLEGMLLERDALAWKVENYRLVLSPVRRLPADILREIFLFTCARSTQNPSHFYLIPPTFLSAVCRSWNDVTVTFPQLWRQCRIEFSAYSTNNGSAIAISRAASCPLWLDLRVSERVSDEVPSYALLLSIASRIQSIRITSNGLLGHDSPDFRLFSRLAVSLEEMDLCVGEGGWGAPGLPAFSPLRTLRHLVMTPFSEFSNPPVDLNWSHLERLVLRARYLGTGGTSIGHTLIILAKARNLRRLTFSDDWERDYSGAGQIVRLPNHSITTIAHLTELVVASCTPTLCDVITNVCTPSLECMIVEGDSKEILPELGHMLQRSGCDLRSLTLQSLKDAHGVDNIDVADALIRRCHSLRELSLLKIDAGIQAIARLLSCLESLSHLRVLALDVSYVTDFSPATENVVADDILTFLESRRAPLAATSTVSRVDLESFTLHSPPEEVFAFTDAQWQRITQLRAAGLMLYICRYDVNDPRLY